MDANIDAHQHADQYTNLYADAHQHADQYTNFYADEHRDGDSHTNANKYSNKHTNDNIFIDAVADKKPTGMTT